MEVDRLGRAALEVCAGEAKIIFAKLATAIKEEMLAKPASQG